MIYLINRRIPFRKNVKLPILFIFYQEPCQHTGVHESLKPQIFLVLTQCAGYWDLLYKK